MATRLKKLFAPIIKKERHEAFKAGFEEGKQAGWDKRILSYENELECLKLLLSQTQHLRWISVKEQMPEKFGLYLVTVETYSGKRYTDVAEYDPFAYRWRTYLGVGKGDKVTHWMPLPEASKE